MWEDPIVAEVRANRDAYAKRFGYDVKKIVADLIKSQEARASARKNTPKPSARRKVKSAAKITAKPSTRTSKRRRAA